MIVGLAVCKIKNNKIIKNKNTIIKMIKKARRRRVDLLLFSEAVLQGFDALTWNYAVDCKRAVSMQSPVIEEIAYICHKYAVAAGFGYIEHYGQALYSSYLIIGKDGRAIANYRRISIGWRIAETDFHYKEGDTPGTFSYMNQHFSIGLCGDFWTDSVLERYPVDAGAVCWPVFTDYTRQEWEHTAQKDYEAQSSKIGTHVFQVNHISHHQSKSCGGAFYYRYGKRVKQLHIGKEGILCVRLTA